MKNKIKDVRLVDAPMYRYWQAFILAFYSSRLYVDVSKRWRGIGLLYLLLAIAVAVIPLATRVTINFNNYFNERLLEPIESLPTLYMQNGKVEFNEPMPYLIKNRKGEVVAIIDTTGVVQAIEGKEYPQLAVLVTSDKLYFRPPKFQLFVNEPTAGEGEHVYTQSLNKQTNEVFIGKQWVASSGVLKLKYLTDIMIYPVMTCFIFAIYFAFALVLAMLGQTLAHVIFKVKLKFIESCRLFIVAATPQIVLLFLMISLDIILPGYGIVYIAVTAAYFSFAIVSIRKEHKQMVHS